MPATASVFLNSKNIEKSLQFYKALGFRVVKEYKDEETGKTGYADLEYQGAELGVGDAGSNPDPEFQKWMSTPLGAGVLVNFSVPNVDRLYAQAQKAGADIEMPISDRPYGRMFLVNDPDGYSLSFLTEPKRRAVAKKGVKKAAKKAAGKARGARKAATKGTRKAAKKAGKKATKAARRR